MSPTTPAADALVRMFPGDGEMARRMRAFDWAATPLGPAASWPESLRSAVGFLLRSKAQIVLFHGPELTTLYNDAYRPVFGAKHPDALGLPVAEAWRELWVEGGIKNLFEGVLATGEAFWASDRPFFMERYGFLEETFFDVSYDPMADDRGRVTGLLCIVTETTGRVISERRMRTLRDVAAGTVEPMSAAEACRITVRILGENAHDLAFALLYLVADDDGAELAAATGVAPGSPAAPTHVDLPSAAASGWPFDEVLATGRAVVVDDVQGRFGRLTGGAWPEAPQTAVVLPIRKTGADRPTGLLVAGVSPRLRLDEQYHAFFELLANQIATAVANARAYDEERRRAAALEELDRAKTAFFSNVSHEFRTPLTLLLAPLEEAIDTWNPPPDQRAQLEVMHRNGLRLLRLVNTLLDFSRIEANRAEATFEPVNVVAYTAELASVFRSAIERAGLTLTVDGGAVTAPVSLDREMYEKIVLNLLSNAFKFTFDGGITVTVAEREGFVDVAIRDTGTGIPPAELPRVFERFHRVKGAHGRTHEGSGIGLALVHELVKLHGGFVHVESEVGRGSTFVVSLPTGARHLAPECVGAARIRTATAVGAAPYVEEALRWLPNATLAGVAEAAPPEARDTTVVTGARIVLADDNADMREYVGRLLRPYWRVEAVADGAAALAAVRRERPDLVLSDVMMPGLDGRELVQAIRADRHLRTIPVILLSARAGEESRVEGLEYGADDYLVKPFSARELLARVNAHLQLARVRAEVAAERERSAARLGREEARHRALVEATSGIIWRADATGAVFAGSQWAEYTGQTHEQMVGAGWIDAIHPDDRESTLALFTQCQRDKRGGTTEHRVRRFDGAYRWMTVTAVPIFDAAGEVEEWVGMLTDIDEIKRASQKLEESEQRFRAMANNAPVMMWITDASHSCTYLNAPWYEFTGQTPETALGDGWRESIHPDDRDRVYVGFLAMSRERQPFQREFRLRRADGEYRWALVAAGPHLGPDGEFLGYIGSVIDITDRKRIEVELEALLGIAQQARAEAERANVAKDDFLAVLSHELRSPMSAMVGWLRVLKSAGGRDPILVTRAIETLERNVWIQAQVINDLLDVSRIMSGKLELERTRVELVTVVTACVESLRPAADGTQVRLVLDLRAEQLELVGDGARLQQVVANLLGNALKFTEPGGTVTVTVERRGSSGIVTVADTGQGIAPEFLPHLFERFRQADSKSSRAHGGLGLGLAIVQHLVAQHGGTVEARSDGVGRGASFQVTLPIAAGATRLALPAAEPAATAAEAAALAVLDVLVVEDDADSRLALEIALEGTGASVRCAGSVQQALEHYEQRAPDVIISDIGMPGQDGYALIRAIRAREEGRTHRTLAIAMTGFAARQDRETALRAGFDEHVAKPVEIDVLLERVRVLDASRSPAKR